MGTTVKSRGERGKGLTALVTPGQAHRLPADVRREVSRTSNFARSAETSRGSSEGVADVTMANRFSTAAANPEGCGNLGYATYNRARGML